LSLVYSSNSYFQLPLSGSHTIRGLSRRSLSRSKVFQLPLSGSRGCRYCFDTTRRTGAFNSLSRDHLMNLKSLGVTSQYSIFQLPLSGSRKSSEAAAASPRQWSFNSLSRDHGCTCSPRSRSKPSWESLSTPSLGITDHHRPDSCSTGQRYSFNSLSRDHLAYLRCL